MLEARRVGMHMGGRLVLADVSLRVEPGSLLAVFGPNGAGKSTLLRILSLITAPSFGEVLVSGRKAGTDDHHLRARIGVLSHQGFLYEGLSATENLDFYARLYDVPDRGRRIREALSRAGLALFASDMVRTYSRGMLQRLAIARALLHDPEILLLDEPYTGLDPFGRELLDEMIGAARALGRTIVLVSHDFAEGLRWADQVMVLARGRVALSGRAAEWPAARLAQVYTQRAGGTAATAAATLAVGGIRP